MPDGFFKPVDRASKKSIEDEFERMHRIFAEIGKPGLMLAQVRQVLDGNGKILDEYSLSVNFIENVEAEKIMQIFGKELISDKEAQERAEKG